MKTPRIANAVGLIDDDLVIGATNSTKTVNKNNWLKWSSIAACFAILLAAAAITLPMMLKGNDPFPPTDTEIGEAVYEKGYFYNVDDGIFSTYIGGKVIAEDKIGNMLSNVSVTAGWKNNTGEWIYTEKLQGEVYSINGISNDVAVALKFIDKGEAVTTTHYYVIMNPNADLTPVKDYIIIPISPNNPEDEMVME
ncbi:MAG: hypothetical protein IJF21_07620 [Clostridia bacterium]|nr:hypothetical protein [Clostridia bacterium]MBQ3229303.1 hypothetical protein [Clostridia bacterium]